MNKQVCEYKIPTLLLQLSSILNKVIPAHMTEYHNIHLKSLSLLAVILLLNATKSVSCCVRRIGGKCTQFVIFSTCSKATAKVRGHNR